jgi:hypothetical protein
MNGVLGMAELLPARSRQAAATLRRLPHRRCDDDQIINDILDDSKIGAGKMELVCEPFDVASWGRRRPQAPPSRRSSICRIEARARGRRRRVEAASAR